MVKKSLVMLILFLFIAAWGFCGGKVEAPAASSQKTKISIFIADRTDSPISNDMPILQEWSKKTNLEIEWRPAQGEEAQIREKFNIMLASRDIPDVVVWLKTDIMKVAERGVFEPLNDLVDNNAPNLKKIISDKPNMLKAMKNEDGKYYFLPQTEENNVQYAFYVRQDWLDKVSLKAPVTIDDWYNMLMAFKTTDMNGNGKNDEIPFTTRLKTDGIIGFAEAWGISLFRVFDIDNGKVIYPYIDPRFKDALAWLSKAYREGLIDPEYITNDIKMWEARLTTEVSGSTKDWFSRGVYLNTTVGKVNPKADFTPVLPPKGPLGQVTKYQIDYVREAATAISKDSKYKKEIVKAFDYWYSEEGSLMIAVGMEGLQWRRVNGKLEWIGVYDPKDPKYDPIIIWKLGRRDIASRGAPLSIVGPLTYPPVNLKAWTMYTPAIKPAFPILTYTPDERDVLNTKYTEIKTYVDEMVNKFIMGVEPLDKYDSFVQKVNSMGIDQVLKAQQEAYDRYSGK